MKKFIISESIISFLFRDFYSVSLTFFFKASQQYTEKTPRLVLAQVERTVLLAMIQSSKRVLGGGQERIRFGDTVYLRLCPLLLVDLSVVAALHLRKCCSDLYQNRELRMGMMRKKLRQALYKGFYREPNLGEWTKWMKNRRGLRMRRC